ncbi:MAG: helix-turn-helix domain-containing protein [Actinomycetota bacterium]
MGLVDVAASLNVHYMTAYRYVRRGLLPAIKVDGEWRIQTDDLDAFRRRRSPSVGRGTKDLPVWSERYERRLLAADGNGAWWVIEDSLVSGASPEHVYLHVMAPAMERIGAEWAAGRLGIFAEHQATVLVQQHLARLSPRFNRPGQKRGTVVLGCPPGERHELGLRVVADLLRSIGFEAVSLGQDTPAEAFAEAAAVAGAVVAIGVSIHRVEPGDRHVEMLQELRALCPGLLLLVGGAGAGELDVPPGVVDHLSYDAEATVRWLDGRLGGDER